MSKKKFTDGLESLFGEAKEDSLQEDSPFLTTTVVIEKKKKKSAKRSGKSFASDLESLFSNAVTEAIEKTSEKEALQQERKSRADRIRSRPRGGLDALIRQTITSSRVDIETTSTKRVTFVFDKRKLVKLKAIAKQEKAYLKDIIGDVVAEYIRHYEQEHGESLPQPS